MANGRGGIFTFLPSQPIVEFNYILLTAGRTRGHHFHPEFDEWLLLTNGHALLTSQAPDGSSIEGIPMSPGTCAHLPRDAARAARDHGLHRRCAHHEAVGRVYAVDCAL